MHSNVEKVTGDINFDSANQGYGESVTCLICAYNNNSMPQPPVGLLWGCAASLAPFT